MTSESIAHASNHDRIGAADARIGVGAVSRGTNIGSASVTVVGARAGAVGDDALMIDASVRSAFVAVVAIEDRARRFAFAAGVVVIDAGTVCADVRGARAQIVAFRAEGTVRNRL